MPKSRTALAMSDEDGALALDDSIEQDILDALMDGLELEHQGHPPLPVPVVPLPAPPAAHHALPGHAGGGGAKGPAGAPAPPATFRWGCFTIHPIKVTTQKPYGGWRASCPFHRFSDVTGCTKSITMTSASPAHNDSALRSLKDLCNQAKHLDRKWLHGAYLIPDPPPTEAFLAENVITDGPVGPVLTDAELDDIECPWRRKEE
eukprot:4564820-Pyramimonas_sp.AAC.1